MRRIASGVIVGLVCQLVAASRDNSAAAQQPVGTPASSATKVVLLGTGTPAATPERSGPATAVVVNDTAYLVDFGPGVVRRASAAATSRAIAALQPTRLRVAFARGCDVLIHEVHTEAWLAARPEAGGAPPGTFRRFSEQFHTTTSQLAELARAAKPRLLILYHYNSRSFEELQADMMKHYTGHFVIGRDLDVY